MQWMCNGRELHSRIKTPYPICRLPPMETHSPGSALEQDLNHASGSGESHFGKTIPITVLASRRSEPLALAAVTGITYHELSSLRPAMKEETPVTFRPRVEMMQQVLS